MGKTLAIGGGDIKLMGPCGFVLGVWPGLLHSILSLILAVLTGVMLFGVRRQDFLPSGCHLPHCFCIGRRNCLLAGGCGRCNLNKWRYQLEQEYFQKPDDYRCGLYPAGRPGLLWHHAPFQCGFEGPDRSGTGESRGDSPVAPISRRIWLRSTPEARPVCLTPLPHHLTR